MEDDLLQSAIEKGIFVMKDTADNEARDVD